MFEPDRMVTVFAPNAMGIDFIRALKGAGLQVCAVVNNSRNDHRLYELGVARIWHVNTFRSTMLSPPPAPVGRIYVFETSFSLTCRLLQVFRPCTYDSIIVVTRQQNPRSIYKLLGANMVLYTHTDQVSFLLTDLIGTCAIK